MPRTPRVAVVGGGLAGLTAARQLNIKSPNRSVDVEIFEAAPRIGGVIETSSVDGFRREHAANGVLGEGRGGAAELAADIGVEMVAASDSAKKRWIYSNGRLREVPSSPFSLVTSDLLSARGKLRLLAEPTRTLQGGEPTVAEFFSHRLGPEVHERVVAPFVSGIYAGDTAELSFPASFPRVASIAAKGGLARGLLSALFGRKSDGASSRRTSAPRGGMGAITERLAEKLTGRIHVGEPVASLARSSRGVDLVTASGRVQHFDAAVCAVPANHAVALFRDADRELAELLSTIPSAPVAVVHLGYRRRDVGHPLDGFGFLAAPVENLDLLGVVFESTIWPERAPGDCVLIRVMIGGRSRPELAALEDQALLDIATRGGRDILEISGEPIHHNVIRYTHAIAQYTVGHRERVERAEQLAAEQGVVLAGASYHGVAVNSVTQDAPRVARRVHEILAAPIAFCLAIWMLATLGACSSANKNKPVAALGDGGVEDIKPDDASTTEPATASAFSPDYQVIEVTDGATISVTVVAPSPPANLVASAGLTACASPLRPELIVNTLGGVTGAVVWLEDAKRGRATTSKKSGVREVLRDCSIEPRVRAVGRLDAVLEIISAQEKEATLSVSFGRDDASLVARATLPMRPIGRGFSLPLAEPGIYWVGGEGVDAGWVAVAGTPYIARTDDKGVALLETVPAGTYSLRVWHPPVAGRSIGRTQKVTVLAGKSLAVEIDLDDVLGKTK